MDVYVQRNAKLHTWIRIKRISAELSTKIRSFEQVKYDFHVSVFSPSFLKGLLKGTRFEDYFAQVQDTLGDSFDKSAELPLSHFEPLEVSVTGLALITSRGLVATQRRSPMIVLDLDSSSKAPITEEKRFFVDRLNQLLQPEPQFQPTLRSHISVGNVAISDESQAREVLAGFTEELPQTAVLDAWQTYSLK